MPEGVFNDTQSVFTHAKLQVKHPATAMLIDEALIAPAGLVPAAILNEGAINTQIHDQELSALGTSGHQLTRHCHSKGAFGHLRCVIISDMKALSLDHLSHELMVVIGLKVTRLTTLPQAVVALCVEQLLFREICQLELMVDVGGNYKELAILEQNQGPCDARVLVLDN